MLSDYLKKQHIIKGLSGILCRLWSYVRGF